MKAANALTGKRRRRSFDAELAQSRLGDALRRGFGTTSKPLYSLPVDLAECLRRLGRD